MDPGRLGLPEELASDIRRSDEWRKYLRTNYYYFSEKRLMISASNNSKWIQFSADMESKEVIGISDIKDDLIGWRSLPFRSSQDGKYLVHEINAPYYSEHVEEAIINEDVKLPELQKKLREILLNADEELDMILVFYKLK